MNLKVRILIRGSNDIASATALTLFRSGYTVVMHDSPQPTVTRRKMAFADAIFDGRAALDGVEAVRIEDLTLLRGMLITPPTIPVVVDNLQKLLNVLRPQVLVDARMRKHSQPENQSNMAPLTIGLGPNFIAGETVHVAIETGWGDHLGQVILKGATSPLEGEPKPIDGHSRDRYVYAPVGGVFETKLQIGDQVSEGQEVARIGIHHLCAPICGVLRGLTHTGVPVAPKTKVIEIDPRIEAPQIGGIGERPRKIAQGVQQAIRLWEQNHAD